MKSYRYKCPNKCDLDSLAIFLVRRLGFQDARIDNKNLDVVISENEGVKFLENFDDDIYRHRNAYETKSHFEFREFAECIAEMCDFKFGIRDFIDNFK